MKKPDKKHRRKLYQDSKYLFLLTNAIRLKHICNGEVIKQEHIQMKSD